MRLEFRAALLGAGALAATACTNDVSLSQSGDVEAGSDATTWGTRHWLAYMENLPLASNGTPSFSVILRARTEATVSVTAPSTGFSDIIAVDAAWTRLDLPDAILYPQGSNLTGIHGLEVTADAPVEVLGVHQRIFFSEASRILPFSELGRRYRVLAAEDATGENRSSFIVAATTDGTVVTVTPAADTIALFPAGQPIEVTLDAGETYQVHSLADLSGSLVEATERVAVFAGGADPAVLCRATSHAWEQLLPIRRWGTDTLAVPLHGQGGDELVVVADRDGTEVRLDCGETVFLDEGDVLRQPIDGPTRVTASDPVGVAQLARGSDCSTTGLGDANMVFTTPSGLFRDGAVLYDGLAFPDAGTSQRDGYAVVRGLPDGLTPDSGYVRDGETTLVGEIRGLAFAVSEFDAYSYSLGYDCVGCVPDLVAPADCGDP